MKRVRACIGVGRAWFLVRLKLAIFLHYLPQLLTGRLSPWRFVQFLRRLLYFVGTLRENKFVTFGGRTRLNLYVPSYPSRAFYTACDKFLAFDRKLPCATVLLSVTSACRYQCRHCYQRHDRGADVGIERLVAVTRRLQDLGVAFFNVEGGEPFLVYDRLKEVCAAIDERSEIWVNSTGDGMTPERLQELRQFPLTAVMFSLHTSSPQELNAFMGSDRAWDTMEAGIRMCHYAGIAVAFNVCLTQTGFRNGEFARIMGRAREFGAAIVQLIKPKPAGAWLDSALEPFSEEDMALVRSLVHQYNFGRDCRSYPPVSAQINEEAPAMFGCTAGGTDRFYVNAKGDVQPCEFLNISFGNIVDEPFDVIYERMRSTFETAGERMLCEAYNPHVAAVMKREGLRSLPLDPERSAAIYHSWDRGQPTELYRRLEKQLR